MKSGLLLIDKPAGVSSAGVVGLLKKRLKAARIGHAGTLDPFATGLLVVLLNSATRLASYAERGHKRYSGIIKLGVATTTDDITGTILSEAGAVPAFEEIYAASRALVGDILQTPPDVSAVKVQGQRAYKLAREGKELSLKARQVQVFEFSLAPLEHDLLSFEISCSKGTYIRALARDLGKMLGCGGCLASLRRLQSGPFSVGAAKEPALAGEQDILDWQKLFPDTPRFEVSALQAALLAQGNKNSLHRIVEEAGLSAAEGMLLYRERATGWPSGILVNENREWGFLVNMME